MALSTLDDFEHGSIVALRHNGNYLSCKNDPFANHGLNVELITREHCNLWEQFRLSKYEDGTVSLQNLGGGFVSPVNDTVGSRWTHRGQSPEGGWERLRVARAGPEGGEQCRVHLQRGNYFVSIDTADPTQVKVGQDATNWLIMLAAVPTLNVAGLGLVDCGNNTWANMEPVQNSGDCARHQCFVRKVLRALKEVGAFYIIGHGLTSDLFDSLVQAKGNLPWKDDAEAADADFKLNLGLMDNGGPKQMAIQNIANGSGVPVGVLTALVEEYYSKAELLSHNLLHVMAVGYGLYTGDCTRPAWRGAWRDDDKLIFLRALFYHPGPSKKSDGTTPVRTTARHTDATWLTLLRNDDCDGLWIRTHIGDRPAKPPLSSALLVNTGNVMKTATTPGGGGNPFYEAVCHWVDRNEMSEQRTRISMPFFYDRKGGASFHGGGTGGC